jgi:hypothetical protein
MLLISLMGGFYASIALLICVTYLSIQMRRVSLEAPGWWKAPLWRVKVLFDPVSLNEAARTYRKRILVCLILYCAAVAWAAIFAVLLAAQD